MTFLQLLFGSNLISSQFHAFDGKGCMSFRCGGISVGRLVVSVPQIYMYGVVKRYGNMYILQYAPKLVMNSSFLMIIFKSVSFHFMSLYIATIFWNMVKFSLGSLCLELLFLRLILLLSCVYLLFLADIITLPLIDTRGDSVAIIYGLFGINVLIDGTTLDGLYGALQQLLYGVNFHG